MSIFFLDTSALLKLYLVEDGTESIVRLAGQVEVRLALATQGELEFRAVLRARERRGDIDAVALAAALLASCVAVHANAGGGALYFVASDRRLLDAAAAEGIPN